MPEEFGEIIIEDQLLEAGFVQVPALVLFDGDLSPGAKTTYAALLWYAWRDRRFPGQEAIARDLGTTDRTIRRHLTELEELRYIRVEQLGLGSTNRYVILSLYERPAPDRTKMSGQTGQKRPVQADKNVRSLNRTLDSTNQTLSHTGAREDLVAALFDALGEAKPAAKRRERADSIIAQLTAEGFTPDVIAEAIRLAAMRGARGPEILPHLVGEAHARLADATPSRSARSAAHTVSHSAPDTPSARTPADASADAHSPAQSRMQADLEAVAALAPDALAAYTERALAQLPPGVSQRMADQVLPGLIAALLAADTSLADPS